jgi:hypothetical protein
MFRLERKLNAQHGPTCFDGFVPREVCLYGVVGINLKRGLQEENLGGLEHGCFVRLV